MPNGIANTCVTCGKSATIRYHFNDDKGHSWYACGDACAVAYQLKDARGGSDATR